MDSTYSKTVRKLSTWQLCSVVGIASTFVFYGVYEYFFQAQWVVFAYMASMIVLFVFAQVRHTRKYVTPLLDATKIKGSIWEELINENREQKKIEKKAEEWLSKISDGEYFLTEEHLNEESSSVLKAIYSLQSKLELFAKEEAKRAWSINGIAKFGQLFRENLNKKIDDLAYQFTSELINYVGANQGGLYIIKNNEEEIPMISLVACFAYNRKKYTKQEFMIGEGLVGQCILEKDTIYLTEVPGDYIKITSGLGEALPTCVIIVPLKINDEVLGAIEIASFKVLNPMEVDFIEKVCESFASIFTTIRNNSNIEQLLVQSQKVTEELKEKEKALLSNEEQLNEAQENLNNKLVELMAESNLTKSIITAINKSNASIQFDLRGNILDANEMYLSMMGYTLKELQGKSETLFVPYDELNSSRYKLLWDGLEQGQFNSGEFKRLAKGGREIWMDAAYNPIMDLNGNPFKILMLATFTTESKVKENEFQNKISALNDVLGMFEVNTDFSIKSANSYMLNQLNMKRKDLKDVTILDLMVDKFNKKDELAKIKQQFSSDGIYQTVVSLTNADGKLVYFETTIRPSKNINGVITCYYVLMKEVNFTTVEQ